MKSFYLIDGYIDILSEVGRWKIIPMKSLYERKNFSISYQMFCRKIKKLESEGFVRSILGDKRRKFITLTPKGSEVCPYGVNFDEAEDSLNHDLIATNIVTKMIEFKNFKTGQVQCFGRGLDIEPDGLIFGQKNGKEYSLAIEVELHQKSKTRLTDKLIKYSNSIYYSYVIYVINKETTYRSYKKILENMTDDVRRKVILLLDDELTPTRFNFEKAHCYFKSEEKSFMDIFGE
jgi:predicted transcriptional regulator